MVVLLSRNDREHRSLATGNRFPRRRCRWNSRRGRASAQAVAAVGIAGLPLNVVVVELDVEIAGAGIGAVDQQDLEGVLLRSGGVGEIINIGPGRPEGIGGFEDAGGVRFLDGAEAVAGRTAGAEVINVGKKRRDDRMPVLAVRPNGVYVLCGPLNVRFPFGC